MNNQTRKFFIYTRKSTDTEDRQVRSISDQLAELKELAVKEQIEVVDIFVEKQTAKAPGRPVFNEMMLRMEAGEASGILAVCFSTKTSTTSSCSFNAKLFNSANWSEILRTCLSLSSVDLRVYMKNFLV